uniref:Uncharacterized protein n=1 Tax=Serratia phage Kevin TaxID=3161161 RepID=A0AAU8KYP6_9CAUD
MNTSRKEQRNARIAEITSWIWQNEINFIAPKFPTPAGWQWHQDHNTKAFYLIFMAPCDKDHVIIDQSFMKQFETPADIMTREGRILSVDLDCDRLVIASAKLNTYFHQASHKPRSHGEWVQVVTQSRPFLTITGNSTNTVGLARELARSIPLGEGEAIMNSGAKNILEHVYKMAQGMLNNRATTNALLSEPMTNQTRYTTAIQLLKSAAAAVHIMILEAESANQRKEGVRPQDLGCKED